jgi:NAD(P)H-nitrite reductase large subunit
LLVSAEPVMPYERPHLSKGYLLGTVARDRLWLRPAEQYRELDVELTLGERVGEAACWVRAWALFAGAGRRGLVAGLDH